MAELLSYLLLSDKSTGILTCILSNVELLPSPPPTNPRQRIPWGVYHADQNRPSPVRRLCSHEPAWATAEEADFAEEGLMT